MKNLKEIREELHKIPELAFEEYQTENYLLKQIENYSELKIHRFEFPGFVAEYSNAEGDYKIFRTDMDALQIDEKTGCSFQSKHPGIMHACGHDVHMTILIGLIRKVIETQLKKNILFVFQPAEESKGGALRMLESGFFDRFPISEVYALHVNGSLQVGEVSSRSGIFFANAEEVDINFYGKSAHIAFSEKGKDALYAGVKFLDLLQEKIINNFPDTDNIKCIFGKLKAGSTRNSIAAECKLEGTFRSFRSVDHYKIKNIITTTTNFISQKYKIKHRLTFPFFYRFVENDPQLKKKLVRICNELNFRFMEAEPVFTGEDFGFFSEKFTSLLFWLGADQGEDHDLHSAEFLPDHRAIQVGLEIFYRLAKEE